MLKSISENFSKLTNFSRFGYINTMAVKHEIDVPFKKATFGMGCFWSGDCLFGVVPGVLRTRVGYSGGQKLNPTYKNIQDHTEVIEIDFDPNQLSFKDLLVLFFRNHEYGITNKLKRQYMSLILYHDDEQKKIAEETKAEDEKRTKLKYTTEIQPVATFYPAEDYHQKFRLQQQSFLAKALGLNSTLLQTSHVAARLNGYVVGLGGVEQFENELPNYGLDEKVADYVRKLLIENKGGNLSC